jgi:hypothetical protein
MGQSEVVPAGAILEKNSLFTEAWRAIIFVHTCLYSSSGYFLTVAGIIASLIKKGSKETADFHNYYKEIVWDLFFFM